MEVLVIKYIILIVLVVIFSLIAFLLGISYRKKIAEKQVGGAEQQAKNIINDAIKAAESKKREALLEAKEEIHKLRQDFDKEVKDRRVELQKTEENFVKQEEALKTKMNEIIANDERIYELNADKKEAISYYTKVKATEKAHNVHNVTNKIVTVHKLRNYINYFYSEMPYSTGCLQKYDLVFLGDNKLVLLFPSPTTKFLFTVAISFVIFINKFSLISNSHKPSCDSISQGSKVLTMYDSIFSFKTIQPIIQFVGNWFVNSSLETTGHFSINSCFFPL